MAGEVLPRIFRVDAGQQLSDDPTIANSLVFQAEDQGIGSNAVIP